MDFIREIKAFEQWLRTNYLPPFAQLMWYKLFVLCNGAGWPEWFVVENNALMGLMHLSNKNSFVDYRNKLLESGLIEFKKGRKGHPSRYKLNSVIAMFSSNKLIPKTDPEICGNKLIPKTDLQTDLQMNLQMNPKTDLQMNPQTCPLYKHKQETKTNTETKTENNNNHVVVVADEGPINESRPPPFEVLVSHGFKQVQKHYEKYIGVMLTGGSTTDIADYLESGIEAGLICLAIEESVDRNVRHWKFIKGIIENCIRDGIKTSEQFIVSQANRKPATPKSNSAGGEHGNTGRNTDKDSKWAKYSNPI